MGCLQRNGRHGHGSNHLWGCGRDSALSHVSRRSPISQESGFALPKLTAISTYLLWISATACFGFITLRMIMKRISALVYEMRLPTQSRQEQIVDPSLGMCL